MSSHGLPVLLTPILLSILCVRSLALPDGTQTFLTNHPGARAGWHVCVAWSTLAWPCRGYSENAAATFVLHLRILNSAVGYDPATNRSRTLRVQEFQSTPIQGLKSLATIARPPGEYRMACLLVGVACLRGMVHARVAMPEAAGIQRRTTRRHLTRSII